MLKVADLFCGPGGISEGFRLAGCRIVYGLDKDKSALLTFEKNHPDAEVVGTDASDLDPNTLPEFDILVGGPPCVNFSTSKGGRANILDGLKLVQSFLRVVYERKPKYWIMENVPRLALHLPESIPLSWIGIEKEGELEVPLRTEFNTADYGVPQLRKRYLVGSYPIPEATHCNPSEAPLLTHVRGCVPWRTLADVLDSLPSPLEKNVNTEVTDPNYGFSIMPTALTDHFYDPTLSNEEAASIRKVKEEHPYMGRMAFPDETNRPARTVVATQLGRETLIIGYKHRSTQHYRRATVRECATLQTFPITYQFWGNSLGARYRMAGDAVPPMLSMLIAREIIRSAGLKPPDNPLVVTEDVQPSPTLILKKGKPKQAALPLLRKFREQVPGKEVRGCRVELDNLGDHPRPAQFCSPPQKHIVEWVARLYVGEGKANMKTQVFSIEEAISILADYPKGQDPKEYQLCIKYLDRLQESLAGEVSDATTLQAAWAEKTNTGGKPDVILDSASKIINDLFPRDSYGKTFVIPTLGYDLIPPRGLRLRIIAGMVAAAFIAELANTDTRWLEENLNERYIPEEWDCKTNSNGVLHTQVPDLKGLFYRKITVSLNEINDCNISS